VRVEEVAARAEGEAGVQARVGVGELEQHAGVAQVGDAPGGAGDGDGVDEARARGVVGRKREVEGGAVGREDEAAGGRGIAADAEVAERPTVPHEQRGIGEGLGHRRDPDDREEGAHEEGNDSDALNAWTGDAMSTSPVHVIRVR
jgi:hypothetical protein